MDYRPLGRTGLEVSAICLGTMTWGQQNTEADAHGQLDAAVAAGVNFIDTAEVYPFPNDPAKQGSTESILGSWLGGRADRDRLVIATKVAGPAAMAPNIAGAHERIDRAAIARALDASLRRLRTDYVDLYQVHWPARRTNFFGRLGYDASGGEDLTPIEEILAGLDDAVRAGKVRHVGVSNETPWGLTRYLGLASAGRGPRIASLQNPYSLLNRTFEIGLAETVIREQVGLLAYSPLGFGMLSGKYAGGAWPADGRLTRFGQKYRRYLTDNGRLAGDEYAALARAHGLEPAQMAIAWVLGRAGVTSAIIGATTPAQIETNLAAASVRLAPEVLAAIDAIHQRLPSPCP